MKEDNQESFQWITLTRFAQIKLSMTGSLKYSKQSYLVSHLGQRCNHVVKLNQDEDDRIRCHS